MCNFSRLRESSRVDEFLLLGSTAKDPTRALFVPSQDASTSVGAARRAFRPFPTRHSPRGHPPFYWGSKNGKLAWLAEPVGLATSRERCLLASGDRPLNATTPQDRWTLLLQGGEGFTRASRLGLAARHRLMAGACQESEASSANGHGCKGRTVRPRSEDALPTRAGSEARATTTISGGLAAAAAARTGAWPQVPTSEPACRESCASDRVHSRAVA
jgi:hypothetical protein